MSQENFLSRNWQHQRFFKAALGAPVLGTLRIFEKNPCVWALWCGVWGLWKFSKFPCVWALYCGMWGLWKFSKLPCVWALYCDVWGLWKIFQKLKNPCAGIFSLYWRDWLFSKKSLCWGFSPVLERLVFSGSKSLYWRHFLLFALQKKSVVINSQQMQWRYKSEH